MNVVTFVVSGILISTFIWLFQRRGWKTWIRVLSSLAAFVATLAFIYFQIGPLTLGAEAKWYETSPYVEIIFFLLLVAGIISRYFTQAIETRREKIAELQKQGGAFAKPRLEFDAWEFSYPFFVSVVTYGALLSQLKDHSFSPANATLSFQTGFFWQTLLATKSKGK